MGDYVLRSGMESEGKIIFMGSQTNKPGVKVISQYKAMKTKLVSMVKSHLFPFLIRFYLG